MPKSRSGYKRRYQAPEGEKIPVSEATYQRLLLAAHANRCTIGQWCEAKLRQFLVLKMTPPSPPPVSEHSPIGKKKRAIEIDERLMLEIGIFAQPKIMTARQWLRSVLLYCLAIEEERLRGAGEQPDRFG